MGQEVADMNPQEDQETRDSFLRDRWQSRLNKLSGLPVPEWKGEVLELHKNMGTWFAERQFRLSASSQSSLSPEMILQYRHELIELTKSIPAINVHLVRYDPGFDVECVVAMTRAFDARMSELIAPASAAAPPH